MIGVGLGLMLIPAWFTALVMSPVVAGLLIAACFIAWFFCRR